MDLHESLGLLGVAIALGTLVVRIMAKKPSVLVTHDKTPAHDVELVTGDGARFDVSDQTGRADVPRRYVRELIIVRHRKSRREVARFVLKGGLNDIAI